MMLSLLVGAFLGHLEPAPPEAVTDEWLSAGTFIVILGAMKVLSLAGLAPPQ
jgi:hypothetical protein